jgi:CRP/FNR family cyclic AMP-dependent transcriptional regulator
MSDLVHKRFPDPDNAPISRGLLAHLGPHARKALLSAGRERMYKKGELLLREGDRSSYVILLLSGRVKIFTSAPNGYEAVLAIRGPGDIVGELACVDTKPRSATVVALQSVNARVLQGQTFEDFLTDHPSAGKVLVRVVAGKLRAANLRRLEFGAYPVQQRLAMVLLDLEKWYGLECEAGRDIDLALSQLDLAGLVGASLEAVSKAVRSLSQAGIIATRRRHVTVLQPNALREVAESGSDNGR